VFAGSDAAQLGLEKTGQQDAQNKTPPKRGKITELRLNQKLSNYFV
jgi:hypothetical protein